MNSRRRSFVAVLMLMILGSTLSIAGTSQANSGANTGWVRRFVAGPTARYSSAIGTYMPANHSAMFGGCNRDIGALVEVDHSAPNGQHVHTQNMAWCESTFRETWAWDGSSWTNVGPATGGPEGRYGATLTWDDKAQALILFGGGTWVMSPTNSPAVPAGSVRCLYQVNHLKILNGDNSGKYLNFYCFNDTWYLKRNSLGVWTWTLKTVPEANKPPARFEHFGSYDKDGRAVIGQGCGAKGPLRFGADKNNPNHYYFDCWHFETSNDPPVDTSGFFRDSWKWDALASKWNRIGYNPNTAPHCRIDQLQDPHCRLGTGAGFDALTNRLAVYGGFFMEHDVDKGFVYNTQGFSNHHVWGWDDDWIFMCLQQDPGCEWKIQAGTPGRRAWSSVATAWVSDNWRPVVFAGQGNVNSPTYPGVALHYDDLWAWQGSLLPDVPPKGQWLQLCGEGCDRPAPTRNRAAMAYRVGLSGQLVMFGGRAEDGSPLGDTWTYSMPSPPGTTLCTTCIAWA